MPTPPPHSKLECNVNFSFYFKRLATPDGHVLPVLASLLSLFRVALWKLLGWPVPAAIAEDVVI